MLRTFSKIYGMAGLRAGFALARQDLLGAHDRWNTGRDAGHGDGGGPRDARGARPRRRAEARQRRAPRRPDALLRRARLPYTPSVSNKLMVDARMPTQQVIEGLKRAQGLRRPAVAGLADARARLDRLGGRHARASRPRSSRSRRDDRPAGRLSGASRAGVHRSLEVGSAFTARTLTRSRKYSSSASSSRRESSSHAMPLRKAMPASTLARR